MPKCLTFVLPILSILLLSFNSAQAANPHCSSALSTAFDRIADHYMAEASSRYGTSEGEISELSSYIDKLKLEYAKATVQRKHELEQTFDFAELIQKLYGAFSPVKVLELIAQKSNFGDLNLYAHESGMLQINELPAAQRLVTEQSLIIFLKAYGAKRAEIVSVYSDVRQLMGYVSSSSTAVVRIYPSKGTQYQEVKVYLKLQKDGSEKVVEVSH